MSGRRRAYREGPGMSPWQAVRARERIEALRHLAHAPADASPKASRAAERRARKRLRNRGAASAVASRARPPVARAPRGRRLGWRPLGPNESVLTTSTPVPLGIHIRERTGGPRWQTRAYRGGQVVLRPTHEPLLKGRGADSVLTCSDCPLEARGSRRHLNGAAGPHQNPAGPNARARRHARRVAAARERRAA